MRRALMIGFVAASSLLVTSPAALAVAITSSDDATGESLIDELLATVQGL